MKTLLYPLAAILLICGGVTTAQATDVYISSDNDDSAITGVIADINEDVIDIIVNGERMAVDVDALDLDNGQQDILNIGDEVRFTGEFDDNEFVADSLRLLKPSTEVNVVAD